MMYDMLLFCLGSILIPLGFVTGVIAGHRHKAKKIVPLVKFVTTQDKEKVLEEFKIHLDGSAKCAVCGEVLTSENVGAVIPKENGYLFLCSQSQCMTVGDFWKPMSRFKK